MNLIFVGLIVTTLLMYLEGLLFSTIVLNFSPIRNRGFKFLALLIWPISVPYIGYGMYKTYAGLLMQLKDNPFLSAMFSPETSMPMFSEPETSFFPIEQMLADKSAIEEFIKPTHCEHNCDNTKEIKDSN